MAIQAEPHELARGVSLREILSIGFRQRRLVAWAFLVPVLLAIAYYAVAHTYYRAETSLIIKTGREYLPQSDGGATYAAPASTKQEEINSEIAILESRGVIGDALDSVGIQNIYPGTSADAGSVKDAAIDRFKHHLDVSVVKLSNVVNLSFEDRNPEMAAKALNALVAAYQAKHIEVYAGERAQVYDKAIKSDLAELDQLGNRRAQLKIDNHIYDVTQQRQALITELADAKRHLDDSGSRLVALKRRVGFLSGQQEHTMSVGGIAGTDADRNAQLVYAQNAIVDLRRTELAMQSRYAPDNPELKQVQDQISGLQQRIDELSRSLSTVQADPASMAQQIGQSLITDQADLVPLNDEIASYKQTVASVDAELQQLEKASNDLDTINRRVEALSDDLKTTRARYDQARALDDLDRAKVVSVAQITPVEVPQKPARPILFVELLIGIGAGLFAAGSTVILSVAMHNTFTCREDTERWLRLPVLVTVPLLDNAREPGLRTAA